MTEPLMLHIDARMHDNVPILKLSGRLTSGIGCQSLAQHIRQMVATGSPRVLVQLNEVSLIDSAGVGELISSFTSVKKSGGLLKGNPGPVFEPHGTKRIVLPLMEVTLATS